ncbi:MAG: hypothetical protein OXD33_03240 [Rhodobacteraceae bacterium]|nr:hypothetical protein [Paracoccaceae bacterium]
MASPVYHSADLGNDDTRVTGVTGDSEVEVAIGGESITDSSNDCPESPDPRPGS